MSDLKLINEWSSDDLYEFFYKVFDVCCDTNIPDLNSLTNKTLKTDNLKTFHKYTADNQSLLGVFENFIELFSKNIQENIIKSRLDDENLSENVKTIVMELYQTQKLRLFKALVYRAAHNTYPCLKNYDWSLLHVISNDQMSDLKTSIIKLSLIVEPSNQNVCLNSKPQTETFTFELTKDELLDFIEFLQKAQKDLLEQLKTNQMI